MEKEMKEKEKPSLFIFTASHTACVSRSFSSTTPVCPQPSFFYPSSFSHHPPSIFPPIEVCMIRKRRSYLQSFLSSFWISVSNNLTQGNLKQNICFWFGLMRKFYKSNTMSCYKDNKYFQKDTFFSIDIFSSTESYKWYIIAKLIS